MEIALGCLAAVLWMVGVVLVMGSDGGNDPSTWAWIDVVCIEEQKTDLMEWSHVNSPIGNLDIRRWILQIGDHDCKIYSTSMDKLQEQIHRRVEH